MADTENTEVLDQGPADAPEQQDPAISMEELNLLMQIVDLAVQRGAFRGNEASQVGAVYDKLATFLGAVAAAQQPEEGEAPVEEEAAPVGE